MKRVCAMVVGLGVTASGALAQAPGETCAQARAITQSFYSFSTANASPDEPAGSCNDAGATAMQNCVWFKYAAASGAEVRLVASFAGGGYQGIIAVHAGACGSLTEIACDSGSVADVAFDAVPGETYYVQVGALGTTPTGGATLVTAIVLGDDVGACPGAPIACGETVEFDSSLLNADAPASTCGSGTTTAHAAWFSFTPEASGSLLVTLDTPIGTAGTLAVYKGSCGALTEVACADAGELRFDAVAGETYTVQAGVASGPGGVSALTLCCDCPAPCPCDLTGDDVLNLDDIDMFATAFISGDLAADLTGDGVLNLDDIAAFADCFVAGCP